MNVSHDQIACPYPCQLETRSINIDEDQMTETLKCELHLGGAVYQLEDLSMTRDVHETEHFDGNQMQRIRVYDGPRKITAVIGDKIE